MKKLIIAAFALVSVNAATFAQAVPVAKKTEGSKMQVVKKTSEVAAPAKVVALKTTATTTPSAAKAAVKAMAAKPEVKAVAVTKPAVNVKPTAAATVNNAAPSKKDGTPDMRYKANKKP